MPTNKIRPASRTPKRAPFDYALDFRAIDFRRRPELYRIGRGEQGVLLAEPYKGEILPHWKFKTVAAAKESAAAIYKLFADYLEAEDFPGADSTRFGVTGIRNHMGTAAFPAFRCSTTFGVTGV